MIPLTIKAGTEKYKLQLPESPDELRFSQFLKIVESDGSELKLLSAITTLPENILEKCKNVYLDDLCLPICEKLDIEYMKRLNNKAPDKQYKNVSQYTLGQKIEAKLAIQNNAQSMYHVFPKMAEIYAGIKEKTYLNGYLPDVYPIGRFFFIQSLTLLTNGQKLSKLKEQLLNNSQA